MLSITEHAAALVAHLDRQERCLFVNRAFATYLGRLPQEVVGRSVREIVGAEAYQAMKPYMDASLAGQEVAYETEMTFPLLGPRIIRAS
ncbi:MAG TPA: PAS domain-containing protein [Chthonomonadaceae bacterium]|nr:PAS domain-containing protein [Chthonomonadaceae bacterium]